MSKESEKIAAEFIALIRAHDPESIPDGDPQKRLIASFAQNISKGDTLQIKLMLSTVAYEGSRDMQQKARELQARVEAFQPSIQDKLTSAKASCIGQKSQSPIRQEQRGER